MDMKRGVLIIDQFKRLDDGILHVDPPTILSQPGSVEGVHTVHVIDLMGIIFRFLARIRERSLGPTLSWAAI